MTTPGPGWHPDPEGHKLLRYWDGQQWTSATQPVPEPTPPPAPIDPEKLAQSRKHALFAVGIVAILIAAYLSVSHLGNRSDDTEAAAAETPTSEVPTTASTTSVASATTRILASPTPTSHGVMRDFWIREDRDGYATMNVNGTYTDAELESAFNEQMRMWKSLKNGDGWFIEINCGDGMNAEGGARQANGKFAITSLGAARTGLSVGGSEFVALPDRKPCPPELPSAAPTAASASDVVDAFVTAGLPATNRADRTISSGCESLQCVQMVAVDEVSVYQFADRAQADRYATAFGADKVYVNGPIAIRYKRDGKNPISESLIPQYNAALDQVMAG